MDRADRLLDHHRSMRFRVLGPMVASGRNDLQLGDRAVLGVLVVRAGSRVSMDELTDAISVTDHRRRTRRSCRVCRPTSTHAQRGHDQRTRGRLLWCSHDDVDAAHFDARRGGPLGGREGRPATYDRTCRLCSGLWRGDPLPSSLHRLLHRLKRSGWSGSMSSSRTSRSKRRCSLAGPRRHRPVRGAGLRDAVHEERSPSGPSAVRGREPG